MKPPKISVIVPIFNVEKYLATCVDSIINQTHNNLEIILVNDESPDKCGEICDEYAKKDSRIKVIHQLNKGLSGARNAGLKVASGDYISFVDSDDWLELDMYESLLEIAIRENLCIIEFDLIQREDIVKTHQNDSKILKEQTKLQIEDISQTYYRIIKYKRFSACRRLFKSKIVENYRFIEGKTSEDVYFTMDVVKKSKKIGYYPCAFYNYRINPMSITRSPYSLKDFDAMDAAFYLFDNVMDFFKDNIKIKGAAQNHLLARLTRQYKLLNYNSNLDPYFTYRKETKKKIDFYYDRTVNDSIEVFLARYLPLNVFHLMMRIHKLKLQYFTF